MIERFGVIARADARGLAYQTRQIIEQLKPERVLIVDMNDHRFPTRYGWGDAYEALGCKVTWWDYGPADDPGARDRAGPVPHGSMDENPIAHRNRRSALDTFFGNIDVCYSAETFYGLHSTAKQRHGVSTILHVNPEFYRPEGEDHEADRLWLPTPWLADRFERSYEVVTMPAPTHWFPSMAMLRADGEPLRVLLPGGHKAVFDRNGVRPSLSALRRTTGVIEVTATTQDPQFPHPSRLSRYVSYHLRRGVTDNVDLYHGQHVALIPRRFGGLCLPAIEACCAGVAPIMSDTPPNNLWPGPRVVAPWGTDELHQPIGEIQLVDPFIPAIARQLDELAASVPLTVLWQEEAFAWARAHSWDAERDAWIERIDGARH